MITDNNVVEEPYHSTPSPELLRKGLVGESTLSYTDAFLAIIPGYIRLVENSSRACM